jgi:hypothetical protein
MVNNLTLKRLDVRDKTNGGWKEVLAEDKRSTPADIACLRIDFKEWLRSLSWKKRGVATLLANGETTGVTAKKAKLSPARISQISHRIWADTMPADSRG